MKCAMMTSCQDGTSRARIKIKLLLYSSKRQDDVCNGANVILAVMVLKSLLIIDNSDLLIYSKTLKPNSFSFASAKLELHEY